MLEGEDGSLTASPPGEIVPSNRHGFYTYEAKYLDEEGAAIKVPADLAPAVSDKVRKLSIEAFRALGCEGLARIDFFLREDGKLMVNEVNTLPGFTNISMYPKVMEALGIGYSELVDRLIRHALARAGSGTAPAKSAAGGRLSPFPLRARNRSVHPTHTEKTMTETLAQLSKGALSDLAGVFAAMPENALDGLIEEIVKAKRIVVFGLGREGLQMRGFAMRLFHMGRNVAVWGDMTDARGRPGRSLHRLRRAWRSPDRATLVDIARNAARARRSSPPSRAEALAKHVDVVTVIPAQTMADDRGGRSPCCRWARCSRPPQMIAFELAILKLRPRFGETSETMRARHTISSEPVSPARTLAAFGSNPRRMRHAWEPFYPARREGAMAIPGQGSGRTLRSSTSPAVTVGRR